MLKKLPYFPCNFLNKNTEYLIEVSSIYRVERDYAPSSSSMG
jgi:hypothetical protein